MKSVEVKDVKKISDGERKLKYYLGKGLDEKSKRLVEQQREISPEDKLKCNVQAINNNNKLIVKTENNIQTLISKCNQDELIKLFGLINTYNILKENEINRLKGVKKLNNIDEINDVNDILERNKKFDNWSKSKIKNMKIEHVAKSYEDMDNGALLSQMKKEQVDKKTKSLSGLLYAKIVGADTDSLAKAIDIISFLNKKYDGDNSLINKMSTILSEKSVIEVYRINVVNKTNENAELVKENPYLRAILESLERKLVPNNLSKAEREKVTDELKKRIGNFKCAFA